MQEAAVGCAGEVQREISAPHPSLAVAALEESYWKASDELLDDVDCPVLRSAIDHDAVNSRIVFALNRRKGFAHEFDAV